MPALANSVFSEGARKEVEALKSLINSETQKDFCLGQRAREAKVNTGRASATLLCQPQR